MKKALYIFFCIYFIALAIMPCGDALTCNENQHVSSSSNHQNEHADEMCSPFCVCACCSSHVVINTFEPTFIYVSEINEAYIVQHELKITSAVISIWQPPKLSV